jgi:exonuclease SbcD
MQIRLSRAGLAAGFRAEVDRIAERFAVRIVDARIAAPETNAVETADAAPLIRLAECQPEELFRSAFEKQHDAPPGPAHLDIFHRVAAEA